MPVTKTTKNMQRIEYVFRESDRPDPPAPAEGERQQQPRPFAEGDVVARYAIHKENKAGQLQLVEQCRLKLLEEIPESKLPHLCTCGVIDEIEEPDRDGNQFSRIVVAGEVRRSSCPDYEFAVEHMPNIKFV